MGSFGNSNAEVLNPHCPCPLATSQYAHMQTLSKIIWGKKSLPDDSNMLCFAHFNPHTENKT